MTRNELISVRVAPNLTAAFDEVASERGMTRSELVRYMVTNCRYICQVLDRELEMKPTDEHIVDHDLAQMVLERAPKDMTVDHLQFLERLIHHVAYLKNLNEVMRTGSAGARIAKRKKRQ